jgi:hypothetical protein
MTDEVIKISQLAELTDPALTDYLVINRHGTPKTTRRVRIDLVSELLKQSPILANTEVLSADRSLTDADAVIQYLDPGGAARDVPLPTPASTNHPFVISNRADADETLTVYDGATAVDTVGQGETKLFVSDGLAWAGLSGGGGGGDSLPIDAIGGLQLQWVSGTALTVGTGYAVLPDGTIINVETAIAKSSLSLSNNTWYHVYLYDNSGTPDIEIVTTAPATAYFGLARAKTGDTSRRYLGSVLTDGSGDIYPFIMQGTKIKYNTANATTPFRVLTSGAETSNTAVSTAGCVPSTAALVFVFAIQNGTPSGFVQNSAGQTLVIALSGQRFAFETFLQSGNLYYKNSTTGGVFHLDILGYEFER